MKLPILYQNDSKGVLRSLEIWTEGSTILTKFGIVDGKMQISSEVATAKNVGRSNETTAEQQAELEATSKWNEKIRKKYRTEITGTKKDYQPMLAKPYDIKLIKFPGYIQPKLDGLRCIAYWLDGKIVLMSRGNKQFNVQHIKDELAKYLPIDWVVDGEIYVHGETLETINSWTPTEKQSVKSESSKLEYHIYDVPVSSYADKFSERLKALKTLFEQSISIKKVATIHVKDMDDLNKWESYFVDSGFEGAIWRNESGAYKYGGRSSDLIKIKRFEDTEFKVIDVVEYQMSDTLNPSTYLTCARFVCQNDLTDDTFECIMASSTKSKAQQLANREQLIGKMLTVQHIGRTAKQIPRNPVGKCFRLEADLKLK